MLTLTIYMVISSLFVQALAFNNKPYLLDLYDDLYNFYLQKTNGRYKNSAKSVTFLALPR